MQGDNNKTTMQDDNNITTTQGGSEQCKMKTNTTYKNNKKNKQAQHIKVAHKKTQMKRSKSLWVSYNVGLLGEGAALKLKPKFPSSLPNPRP
jgi:hypothetical protein